MLYVSHSALGIRFRYPLKFRSILDKSSKHVSLQKFSYSRNYYYLHTRLHNISPWKLAIVSDYQKLFITDSSSPEYSEWRVIKIESTSI